MRLRTYSALVCILAASAVAAASPITYNVNVSSGGATATGTITTDGNLGAISILDITAFQLVLSQGQSTTTFGTDDFSGAYTEVGFLDGSFTATSSGLFFDSSVDPDDYISFFDFNTNGLCFTSAANLCGMGTAGPAPATVITVGGSDYANVTAGIQQIAAIPTPEPSSLALLGTGALGMIGAFRRRFV